ncbi:FG-GAP-like repeat-containing protein [Arthrobacter sp. SO5]|uniref:FG-GAP-like repeat-containing protein n=1 Tax=Arthrobacter sp. SO5 TaxID=1897055 RepID=UPI0022B25FFC|nr:FG-GAP-like repeat-containing protein [Arthrobacter sp. SO5]
MPLPATLTKSVLTHEFGHVLGLMHANRLRCADGAVDTASNADGSFINGTCSIEEYKDNLDLMGVSQTSQPVVSSPIYEFGGFGSGNEVRNLGKAVGKKSYELRAWGSADDNRALKFTDPVSGEIYYLELRLPVGNDAATARSGNRGVKVVQAYGAGSLALQPSTTTFSGYYSNNQAWQAGQRFTTHAGTRVTIDWISDSAAGVTIDSLPPAKPLLIAPGDFNGDGIADLIMRRANGELWLHPGDGAGKSLPGRRIGTGWEVFDSIFGSGDFNGDGRNDLVARKFDGSLWFYAGSGTVTSSSEGYRPGVKVGDFGWDGFDALIGVRDFDGDSYADILARRPDGVLFLYPGNGSGKPGTPRQIDFGWQIFDRLIALQDFNGDGTNDLAGRREDGTLWFYANTGRASFAGAQQIGTGWQIYDDIVGVGDADSDRLADFVGRQADGNTFFYAGTAMRDQGYKGARKIGDFGWDAFNSLSGTKDLNGDNIDDLLARMDDGSLWFYPGNGSGAYAAPTKIGKFGWEVFDSLTGIGDFSGDGKNDLLARKPDGTLWFYPGTGRVDATNSGLASPIKIGDFGWEAFTSLTAVRDLNGDGKNDLLGRMADGSLWLYAGTGRVNSTSNGYAGGQKVGNFGWDVFDHLLGAGDYNSDGKNDVLARMPDGTLWMYPGTGTGKFSTPRRVGTGWNIFDSVVSAGNLDRDSFPDIIARRPDGSLWSYAGTGMQTNEGYLGRAYAGGL